MNGTERNKEVLDYATPASSSSRAGKPVMGNLQARMIGSAVMFVGACVLAVSRRDTEILGIFIGFAALFTFVWEYVRSWRQGD